jgi:hypothetical protein
MPPLRLRLSLRLRARPGPGARERIGKKTYIRATGYASEPFDRGMANARVKGWRIYEVPCGHDVMLDMPERLTAILQEAL